MSDNELRERLAAYAHEAWSGWMKHLFSKCEDGDFFGKAVIPAWAVVRWQHQMNTPYEKLPETGKESDRKEADEMLAIIRAARGDEPERLDITSEERIAQLEVDLKAADEEAKKLRDMICDEWRKDADEPEQSDMKSAGEMLDLPNDVGWWARDYDEDALVKGAKQFVVHLTRWEFHDEDVFFQWGDDKPAILPIKEFQKIFGRKWYRIYMPWEQPAATEPEQSALSDEDAQWRDGANEYIADLEREVADLEARLDTHAYAVLPDEDAQVLELVRLASLLDAYVATSEHCGRTYAHVLWLENEDEWFSPLPDAITELRSRLAPKPQRPTAESMIAGMRKCKTSDDLWDWWQDTLEDWHAAAGGDDERTD